MLPPSINPAVDARVRAAWQEQVAAAGKTPGLLPELIQRRQDLLPRFGACYTQLCALPRRVRRVLQRKCKQSLAGVALLLALGQEPVLAATINVSGGCSLINAITAANTDTATGGCPQGNGADTLVLANSSIHTLTAVNNTTYGSTGLPVVSSAITIEGQNSTIRREGSAPDFRILAVGSTGELTLKETTVSGGIGSGSGGGGVLNSGTLTIQNSTLSGNSAGYFRAGGGVYNFFGSILTITDSTLSGNSAYLNGGGVFNADYATLTLTNSTLSGNVTNRDGGGVANRGTLTIQNSTLSGNSAAEEGGGVSNSGSILTTMTITDSTLSGNSVSFGSGGGVANRGTLTIQNSTLSGNSAYVFGGGVNSVGSLTIQNSTLSGNKANFGGGVFHCCGYSDETLTIQNSTLSGNSANFSGGGVQNDGTMTITHSTLSGNSAAEEGGGVENLGGTLTIQNSTLSGNSAYSGGGVRNDLATLTLTDSTLSGNTASEGGGVFTNYDATLTLAHTLVSGNTATVNGPEIYNSGGYSSPPGTVNANNFNLFGHDGNAGVSGFTPGPTDIVPTVPLSAILDALADNGGPTLTHALVSGSPALDAVATGCPPPATDQRGFLRPADGDSMPGALCDIGAFELAALPPVLNDLVTFVPLPATFSTTSNTAGCPPGFVGKFSFTARLTDKDTSPPLSDLTVEVDTLTNGNLLQNADGGPGEVGATLTVAKQGQFADGVLSAGELVDVPFVICLQQRGPFTFFVDVLGVEQ